MLTTQLPICLLLTFPLSFLNYRLPQQKFLIGLVIINPGKYHLLLSTESLEIVSIDGMQIITSTAETLLGIIIDSELNFENLLSAICNKR